MTPSETEPATFWLVAWCFNLQRYSVPKNPLIVLINFAEFLSVVSKMKLEDTGKKVTSPYVSFLPFRSNNSLPNSPVKVCNHFQNSHFTTWNCNINVIVILHYQLVLLTDDSFVCLTSLSSCCGKGQVITASSTCSKPHDHIPAPWIRSSQLTTL
jgi:hypothetical protein